MIWDKGTSKRNLRKGLAADAPQSLAMSLAFAAVSAALGAVVSQLSDRGSKAFVDHRHREAQPLIPRLDDGFCWLTDDSSLEFRQGTISQSTGTISPAQFRHTISAFHCEVIHRGVRRLPCDNKAMVTNATIEALLGRRSIRKFKDEAIDDDTRATLETVARHAASSQFLNDWSAIRITDPATKAKLAEFGHQPYIATAPLLYVFVIDEHRNARIAERKGIDPASDEFHLKYSYRFTQAQNDAVLALHAMETAAYSLGLGCVILGSLLNNIPGLIDVLNLPEYTYPVLGLAIGKPDQNPTVKPRMPRTMQFFENTHPADADGVLDQLPAFDEEVHRYYDLRQADRPGGRFQRSGRHDQSAGCQPSDTARQGRRSGLPSGSVRPEPTR